MPSVEITAKSVQEATKAAAEKLGVSPENVTVIVLEETKGLFGKSTVRVRAEAAEPTPAAATVAEPQAPAESPLQDIQEAFEEPTTAVKKTSRGRGGKKAAPPKEEAEPAPAAAEPAAEQPAAEEVTDTQIVATEADAAQLTELVRELLAAADLNVNAQVGEISGRYVNVTLDGKDAAFLVGKHGEVLNAMQYLVNIIAGRRFDNGVRATLDGNDYRRRREEALTGLATKIAEQVKKRGEEAVLDALPAFERRIVHKALSTYDGISTYSEGEEPNRRVVIAPAE
jgi:spoIIIJ-associated protein